MPNMSYCRFHNTRLDLSECLDALYDEEELSVSEARAARNMFQMFLDYCLREDIIERYDLEPFDEILNNLKEDDEEEDNDE